MYFNHGHPLVYLGLHTTKSHVESSIILHYLSTSMLESSTYVFWFALHTHKDKEASTE